MDVVRQAPKIDFWTAELSQTVYHRELRHWMEVGEDVKVPEHSLTSALKKASKTYESFEVKVGEQGDRPDGWDKRITVQIVLREGYEWKNAWEEAWKLPASWSWTRMKPWSVAITAFWKPRVARSSQPWAEGCNPVGIEGGEIADSE